MSKKNVNIGLIGGSCIGKLAAHEIARSREEVVIVADSKTMNEENPLYDKGISFINIQRPIQSHLTRKERRKLQRKNKRT